MGTIATHKPCKFQEYQLRKSPLLGEKVAKISDFGGFSNWKSPNMGRLGSNLAGLGGYVLPNLTQIVAAVHHVGQKKFYTGSFLPVIIRLLSTRVGNGSKTTESLKV